MTPQARMEFVHTSIGNAVTALLEIEKHLRKLPTKELSMLRSSARSLLARCPYTHATFVTVAAARDAVRTLPKHDARPAAKGRDRSLAMVRRSFEVQGRIMEILDIPAALAAIQSKGQVDKLIATATAKMKTEKLPLPTHSGLARAYALLSTVKARVDALPKKSQEELQAAQRRFAAPTAGLWNFKVIMIRCANELESALSTADKRIWIQPKSEAPQHHVLATELLSVLRSHFVLYC